MRSPTYVTSQDAFPNTNLLRSKPLGSVEEDHIAGLVQGNMTLCKFGVDLRGTLAQTEVDRITARNRELARKMRHEQGVGPTKPPSASANACA